MSAEGVSFLGMPTRNFWKFESLKWPFPALGVVNGKSETRRDAETDILKSETETENFSDLIEKHIYDRQTQNLRLQDPLVGCARFWDLGRICRDFSFFRDHSPPLAFWDKFCTHLIPIFASKLCFCKKNPKRGGGGTPPWIRHWAGGMHPSSSQVLPAPLLVQCSQWEAVAWF